MRPYQKKGVTRLIALYRNGLNGILADQFGLGKAAQVTGLLAHLWSHEVYGPFLIVCPTARLAHWVSEVQRWCPSMPVVIYHGSKQEREELRSKYIKEGG